jgi:predicted 3-demethylubiquinone-9 3-methyltransferase (glyoxalase superfamily)
MGTNVATALMFVGDQCGRAKEAVGFYAATIPNVTVGNIECIDQPDDPSVGGLRRDEFTIGWSSAHHL